MTSAILEHLRGPVVVIDNKVKDPSSSVRPIVDDLEAAGVLVLAMSEAPDARFEQSLAHCALIVLDWDLLDLDPGVAAPAGLKEENDRSQCELVDRLLKLSPNSVFIVSADSPDDIRRKLASFGLGASKMLRVSVTSKADYTSGSVLAQLEAVLRSHAGTFALSRWDVAYDLGRREFFGEIQEIAPDWAPVLWAAFGSDSVAPDKDFAEVIARNILNRMRPVDFETDATGTASDMDSVRRIIHRSSVIPASSLNPMQLSPGDIYVSAAEDMPPAQIHICVSADCDLARRPGADSSEVVSVPAILLKAKLIAPSEYRRERGVLRVNGDRDSSRMAILEVLTEGADPYRVLYSSWEVISLPSVELVRIGRLLDPYTTLLQEGFGAFLHRRGLPHLPDGFSLVPIKLKDEPGAV